MLRPPRRPGARPRRSRPALVAWAAIGLAAWACAKQQASPEVRPVTAGQASVAVPAEGLERIDAAELRARLEVFAADSMEGRRAGTAGGERAAAYLARELEALGVETVGSGGSFLHGFAIEGEAAGTSDSTQNVVAWIAGSDPARAGQIVAIGAHYDGLGIGPPVEGDSIYNGADDDGTGSMALLELAEALSHGPRPGRSILLVWHGGEEAGLLGSEHLTAHPPVARDSIVAQLNMDMLGRNAPDELFLIGAGRISSELEAIIGRHAEAAGLRLDGSLDAPDHPERLYERSDHYMYARYGIPVAFFFAGLHADYHQPSDEVDRIDFDKVERVAELVYRVAWDLANRPEPPARDRLRAGPGT